MKIFSLIRFELKILSRAHNLIKHLIIFFLFATVSIVLLSKYDRLKEFGIIFSIIFYPLSLMSFASAVFKNDLNNGRLENLISCYEPFEIVLAKYFALNACVSFSLFCNLILSIIIFNITEINLICGLFASLILLLLLTVALLILSGAIICYFRTCANYQTIIILPLLIPSIVISGLILQEVLNIHLIYILAGINFVLIPLALILSTFLLKSIYNI